MKRSLKMVPALLAASVVTVIWAPLHAGGVAAEWMEKRIGPLMGRMWKWVDK